VNGIFKLLGWGYVAVCTALIVTTLRSPAPSGHGVVISHAGATDAESWFRRVKPYCNAVEIGVLQNQHPPPSTIEGAGYHAACFALAGQIDNARKLIDRISPGDRHRAAGIVFDVGHPVADAGDDRSAGPIMELVIDYWPNHYMALYHAGMSEYMLGQHALARKNLAAFLDIYKESDGWRSNGIEVLRRLTDSTADKDLRRPREPGR
jgi:hypothetical protein